MTAAVAVLRRPRTVRWCGTALARVVRGRSGEPGGEWGEALLAELHEASTGAEALRWTMSGLPMAWRERRRGRAEARAAGLDHARARRWRWIAGIAAALVLVVFLLNAFVATVVDVRSPAMQPTYGLGSRVLVDRVGFHLTGLKRGDVVMVNMPGEFSGGLKRVAGLPGDRMSCVGGALLRNGVAVRGTTNSGIDCAPVTVPAGHVYLAGDNRTLSYDSRQFGPVPTSDVVARADGKIWPLL